MSGFEADALAALPESLARMGLLASGEPHEITPLAGGVSSFIARVDTPRGPLCYKRALPRLRTAREWNAPVARARSEAAYLRVAAAIVPGQVPSVVGWDDESLALALTWLDPAEHRLLKADLLEGRMDRAVAEAVGRALARLHEHTCDDAELAVRFANDADFDALRLDPYLRATAIAHPDLAPHILATIAETSSQKRALVHGDVSPKNILVGPHGPVFLDAETAWFGEPAFDLAFVLNHYLLKGAHRPASWPSFREGFEALASTYLHGTRDAARTEHAAARLLSALMLARIDGKSPVEYLDEPTRQRVRRAGRAAIAAEPSELGRVADLLAKELPR